MLGPPLPGAELVRACRSSHSARTVVRCSGISRGLQSSACRTVGAPRPGRRRHGPGRSPRPPASLSRPAGRSGSGQIAVRSWDRSEPAAPMSPRPRRRDRGRCGSRLARRSRPDRRNLGGEVDGTQPDRGPADNREPVGMPEGWPPGRTAQASACSVVPVAAPACSRSAVSAPSSFSGRASLERGTDGPRGSPRPARARPAPHAAPPAARARQHPQRQNVSLHVNRRRQRPPVPSAWPTSGRTLPPGACP